MLKLEPTYTSYCIDIAMEQMKLIMLSEGWKWDGPELNEKSFNGIGGVERYECDGHFGAAIFLMIDIDYDTPETHKDILEVITDFFAAVETHAKELKLSEDE